MTTATGHVAEDVSFEGPMAQATGAEAVVDAISGFSELVTELKILAATGDDQQAVVMYEMVTEAFGTLRAAEHLIVRDGKIQASKLVFDTHEVRKATTPRAPSG